MGEVIKLQPNVPVEIALRFPTGKMVTSQMTGNQQVMFSLAGDKVIYLDLGPAQQINDLGVKPGETFHLVKRWTGKKTDRPEFDCWLSIATEKARAVREAVTATPESQIEAQLQASLKLAEARKPAAPAESAAPAVKATGTYGPAAVPARAPREIPAKRPFGEAFQRFLIDAGRATRAAELALGAEGGSVRFDSRDVAAIATSMFIEAAKQGGFAWNGGGE
jgi:hypothetical protein